MGASSRKLHCQSDPHFSPLPRVQDLSADDDLCTVDERNVGEMGCHPHCGSFCYSYYRPYCSYYYPYPSYCHGSSCHGCGPCCGSGHLCSSVASMNSNKNL